MQLSVERDYCSPGNGAVGAVDLDLSIDDEESDVEGLDKVDIADEVDA